MSNKEEWEKLEKWYKEKQDEEKEKYGVKLSNEEMQKGIKKVNVFVRIINVLGSFLKKAGIIGIATICILVGIILSTIFLNLNPKIDVDIVSTIEQRYNIETKLLLNNKEKYTFARKDIGEIKFVVFKEGGSITEDYSARAHKYFFDRWQSNYKKDFTVEKKFNNDLMSYATYIENFTNIEDATKMIIEFANYCGDEFMANWDIYIKKGDIRIYPYTGKGQTAEEALKNAKETYNKYF